MSVDGIGKKSGLEPPSSVLPTNGEAMSSHAIQGKPAIDVRQVVESGASPDVTAAMPAAGPLAELQAGRIDVEQYVDLKIQQATAHLEGIPGVNLVEVQRLLRDKLVEDPTLQRLLRDATGAALPGDDP
jgi:hypothetical protein